VQNGGIAVFVRYVACRCSWRSGLSAWFTPAVRAQLGNVIGSTVKGIIADRPGIHRGADATKNLSLGRSEGAPATLAEQVMKPALNIDSFHSGITEPNDAIPSQADIYLDFRLVTNQSLAKVKHAVEKHIRDQGYFIVGLEPQAESRAEHERSIKLIWLDGYPAQQTPLDVPVARSVAAAIKAGTGNQPIVVPMVGASSPLSEIAEVIHSPIVGIPFTNYDNNQHAENENIKLQSLWDGIEIYVSILSGAGMDMKDNHP